MNGLYERRTDPTGEHHVFYVAGEPGVVAQVMYEGANTATRYVIGDGIGSATLILKEDGSVVENDYNPFGGRMDELGKEIQGPGADPATTLGFTGHEHDEGGLINMRGRIYDRNQFRFITPDPVVTNPLFGQSHYPYSYVVNNPLRYTDPTGFQSDDDSPPSPPPDETITEYDDPDQTLTCTDSTGGTCGGNSPSNSSDIMTDSDSGTPRSDTPSQTIVSLTPPAPTLASTHDQVTSIASPLCSFASYLSVGSTAIDIETRISQSVYLLQIDRAIGNVNGSRFLRLLARSDLTSTR